MKLFSLTNKKSATNKSNVTVETIKHKLASYQSQQGKSTFVSPALSVKDTLELAVNGDGFDYYKVDINEDEAMDSSACGAFTFHCSVA